MAFSHFSPVLAFYTPGALEWVVIGIVAVVLFGKRLPELGRTLGRSLVEFKRGLNEMKGEIEDAAEEARRNDYAPRAPKPEKPEE